MKATMLAIATTLLGTMAYVLVGIMLASVS